jgi:hypothetical protein
MASLWNLWGGDMFPREKDPTGGIWLLNLCAPFMVSYAPTRTLRTALCQIGLT